MAISQKLRAALRTALIVPGASREIETILAAGVGGQALSATDSPTFAAVTVTGDATVGGDVKVPTGKGLKVNGVKVVGAQQSAVVPIAVTFSAAAPATYASPTGALTVSNGGTPTVAELLAYCNELRANVVNLQAVLHTHGLTA